MTIAIAMKHDQRTSAEAEGPLELPGMRNHRLNVGYRTQYVTIRAARALRARCSAVSRCCAGRAKREGASPSQSLNPPPWPGTSKGRGFPQLPLAPAPRPRPFMQLTIRNLSKRYANGVQALAAVSLTVPPGMFGLLGPNGAGKSTLMRTLATLQSADSGSATLGDIDVLREPERVRAVLGYLPQDFGVYPKVSAVRAARSSRAAQGPGRREVAPRDGRRAPASREPALRCASRSSAASPAACASASASRRRCSAIPSSSSSTSRPRASTRRSACASTTCWPTSRRTSS